MKIKNDGWETNLPRFKSRAYNNIPILALSNIPIPVLKKDPNIDK